MNGLKLPVEWRERIEDMAAGRIQPVAPRHAATVEYEARDSPLDRDEVRVALQQ